MDIPKEIRLITLRDTIKTVPEGWRAQYGHGYYANDPEKQGVQSRLDALDTNSCTAKQIDEAIGNDSWTDLHCDACGTYRNEVVAQIGEEPDYEARWLDFCLPCLARLGRFAADYMERDK